MEGLQPSWCAAKESNLRFDSDEEGPSPLGRLAPRDWRFMILRRDGVARPCRSPSRGYVAAEQQDSEEHSERDVDRPAERRPDRRHAGVRDQIVVQPVEHPVTGDPGRGPP